MNLKSKVHFILWDENKKNPDRILNVKLMSLIAEMTENVIKKVW